MSKTKFFIFSALVIMLLTGIVYHFPPKIVIEVLFVLTMSVLLYVVVDIVILLIKGERL